MNTNRRKRIRTIIVLIAIFAVFSIVTTFAWFSTQKDVSLTGLNVKVEVAESMQISLNGDEWFQDIAITDMAQLTGTSTLTGLHQANATNSNYVPTKLEPVSTDGTISSGKLLFKKGLINGIKLEGITDCNETTLETANNADHPYLFFDLYVRNVSATQSGLDDLKLNLGSSVTAGQDGLGLAESVRVGFVANNTSTVSLEASGSEVRAGTAGGANDQIAIWEPNYLEHTDAVVQNDPRITAKSQAYVTYAVANTAGTSIADITSESDSALTKVTTNHIPYETIYNQTSDASELKTTVENVNLGIAPNKITKVRIYLWLEGQDPDCVDVASTGQNVHANIKLTKDASGQSEDFSFDIEYTKSGDTYTFNVVDDSDMAIVYLNYDGPNGTGQSQTFETTLSTSQIGPGSTVYAEGTKDGQMYTSSTITITE